MERQEIVRAAVAEYAPGRAFDLSFAAADADFRRYWRAVFADGGSLVIMDAPPDKMRIAPYLAVQKIFSAVRVPQVYRADEKNGIVLLEDLGKFTLLDVLRGDTREEVHKLFLLEAVDTLVDLQASSQPGMLPEYDAALLRRELDLFPEWYAAHEAGKPFSATQRQRWQACTGPLVAALLSQPKVYVHRDFIVRNLMPGKGRPGVLDFQDAVYGMITYDILCLTRDAFIGWEEAFTLDIVIRYWQKARARGLPVPADFDTFYRDYEWCGVQRHLKVIGIFARLKHRDGKEKYAAEIPRFIAYLYPVLRRYAGLHPLYNLLTEIFGADPAVHSGFTF